jgi:hypothetical protein
MTPEKKPVIILHVTKKSKIELMCDEEDRNRALRFKLVRKLKRNQEDHGFPMGCWSDSDYE